MTSPTSMSAGHQMGRVQAGQSGSSAIHSASLGLTKVSLECVYKDDNGQDTALHHLISCPFTPMRAVCSLSPTSRQGGFHTEKPRNSTFIFPLPSPGSPPGPPNHHRPPLISARRQPHSCLLLSPSLWRHHHLRDPEQDRLPGCVGPHAHIYPQNLPDSSTPSLFKQLCRANEGSGRDIGEGKPPSSRQALNSEHTGSTLCRPERVMHLPAEGAHKATPSPPTHTPLFL